MRVLLTDSTYIEIKPYKEVYINYESNDMFLGFCYLGIVILTCYLKRK